MVRFIKVILTFALLFPVASHAAQNFYELLGVARNASSEEIKMAYRRLAMKYHPDRNPEVDRSVFQGIKEAYDTLSDQTKRARYDAAVGTERRGGGFQNNFQSQNQRQEREKEFQRQADEARQRESTRSEAFFNDLKDQFEAFIAARSEYNENRLADLLARQEALPLGDRLASYFDRTGWAFVASHVLKDRQWRESRPDLIKLWLKETTIHADRSVIQALVSNYFPIIAVSADKRLIFKDLIRQGQNNPEIYSLLAELMPISERETSYGEEFSELVKVSDVQSKIILAKRFNLLFQSPMAEYFPNEYKRTNEELKEFANSDQAMQEEYVKKPERKTKNSCSKIFS